MVFRSTFAAESFWVARSRGGVLVSRGGGEEMVGGAEVGVGGGVGVVCVGFGVVGEERRGFVGGGAAGKTETGETGAHDYREGAGLGSERGCELG